MTQRRPDRTLGHNHDIFWNFCAQDELHIQRCTACDKLVWPSARTCEFCGGEAFTWQRMSGRGKIVSWTAFVQDYYRGMMPVPYDTLLVELEEGPLFISNPLDFSYDDIVPGMPVELRFIDAEDSAGAFRLPIFARAAG